MRLHTGNLFLLLLKKHLKSPGLYLLAGLFVLLFFSYDHVLLPGLQPRSYGIVNQAGSRGDAVIKTLSSGEASLIPTVLNDRQELREQVKSGALDCGFVLEKELASVRVSDDFPPCILCFATASSQRVPVLREKVYDALFLELASDALREAAEGTDIFTEPDEDLAPSLEKTYRELLTQDNLFHLEYEEQGSKKTAGDSLPAPVLLAALFLFACSLVFAGEGFRPKNRLLPAALASWERRLYTFFSVFCPTLLLAAVPVVLLFFRSASMGFRSLLFMPLYAGLASLWACLFSALFRREAVYLAFLPFVLLLCVLTLRGLPLAGLLPGGNVLSWLFPPNYLLLVYS